MSKDPPLTTGTTYPLALGLTLQIRQKHNWVGCSQYVIIYLMNGSNDSKSWVVRKVESPPTVLHTRIHHLWLEFTGCRNIQLNMRISILISKFQVVSWGKLSIWLEITKRCLQPSNRPDLCIFHGDIAFLENNCISCIDSWVVGLKKYVRGHLVQTIHLYK